MFAGVIVACALGAAVAFAREPCTAGSALAGWVALYGIPSVLILGKKVPFRKALKSSGRLILIGAPVACLYGLLSFAMSGYVGLVGGFASMMLMIGWGSLLAAAFSTYKSVMPQDGLDLLPRMSPVDRPKNLSGWMGARVIVVLGMYVLLLGWVAWHFLRGRDLDPVAWQDPVRVQQGVRLAMADRLLARGTLQGKTQQQVIKLLGKPSDEGYFRDWHLVYWLGRERGFISIDSEWLVLRLGPDHRVIECRIVRD